MQIWNHHPITGELLGPSTADPNPMEPGEWIVPAHATTANPGAPQPGSVYVFSGSAWTDVPDHRGETWWKADAKDNTAPVTIDFIGDPADRELTNVEPPAPPVIVRPIIVSPRQMRQALNQLGLRAAVESWVQAADQDVRDNWQYATEFVRGSNLVEAAAEDLGTAPADVDLLFEIAKSL